MRILLVLLMILGTSSVFSKGRSSKQDKGKKVESRHLGGDKRYDQGHYRGRKYSHYSKNHKKYHYRPKRIVRYERKPRVALWPRFSLFFNL